MDYSKTLNLPFTYFPMKANLPLTESEKLAYWKKIDLYAKLEEAGQGRPGFILHDGPPYANGHIHIGHALNKILKDIIVKSKRMQGYHAPYVPGWDCHGLPIELQVDNRLGSRKKELSKLEFRRECRAHAEKFVAFQKEEFIRLGVVGDWNNPYLTMSNEYEGITAEELARLTHNGGLYRGRKPVHWCCSCVTALAEAEVEYADHTSSSIYVRFAIQEDLSELIPSLEGKQVSIAIWTTTPWTIPANLAIVLNPDYDYVALDTENGVLIVADGLKERFLSTVGLSGKVLATFKAGVLERKLCRHPLYDRDTIILLGEHVTQDSGTGCVHTAPGHGHEDYQLALAEGLEIYSPVDNHGRYIKDLEFFGGEFVLDANKPVINKLDEVGALLKVSTIYHSYPHCWRCKKPVIIRATEQWFISMEANGLRKKALEAIDKVQWFPKWGGERIHEMIEKRPDWCISRQRTWGVPITAFSCRDCGEYLADGDIMTHVAELFKIHGSDLWFDWEAEKLLPDGTKCPKCGASSFEKGMDILDVWFDSGVSHAAVLEPRPELRSPADMYLEGSDQHRGWFNSSLLESVGTRGVAPYRSVMTHGFVQDGAGRMMSKSVGNVVPPEEVISRYGADVLRLWVASQDQSEDTFISREILERVSEAYRRIRNTCRYLLGNINNFDPLQDAVTYENLPELERWALHRLELLKEKVLAAYNRYEFYSIYHDVIQFCSMDLSSLYLDINKVRIYPSGNESQLRRSYQTVIYKILDTLVRLIAPVLSFTAEEVWGYITGNCEDSVHLCQFLPLNPEWKDDDLAERWERIFKVKAEVDKALELTRKSNLIGHSLDAMVKITANPELLDLLQNYADELDSVFIVSKVELTDYIDNGYISRTVAGLNIVVVRAKGEKCERCWSYSEDIGLNNDRPGICARCISALG